MTRRDLRILKQRPGDLIGLPARGGLAEDVHVFEGAAILAINAALAARRPLLVRGEPGTGKSQLARAAAEALGRVLLSKVLDARTEAQDLFYSFDALARLAEAQILGAVMRESADLAKARERLDEYRFLSPGLLWWAFDWPSAMEQAQEVKALIPTPPPAWHPDDGCVVLLDEIDKADTSVPNGLLEALGNGAFPVPRRLPISMKRDRAPLVIVTTNEERALPDAFLRRCLVLQLALPEEEGPLAIRLIERGTAHFPGCPHSVLSRVAELLIGERKAAREAGLAPPGQAEYLDLLQAVSELARGDERRQLDLLEQVAPFALRKHPREAAG